MQQPVTIKDRDLPPESDEPKVLAFWRVQRGEREDKYGCGLCGPVVKTFVVNSGDKEGLHWFVCGMDCCVCLNCFVIFLWEPLSPITLIHPFLGVLKRPIFTTKHRALGFQKDGWSCAFQSLHITPQLVEHWVALPHPKFCAPPVFVCRLLSTRNADLFVRITQAPNNVSQELLCPPTSFPSMKVQG